MALTPLDRTLIQRCLNHDPGAWNDFVDRYLGLIYHVVHHTAHLRSVPLRPEDVEDLAAEVLLRIVSGDYHVLRQFQGRSSLASYLTVIVRRICVHELARMAAASQLRRPGEPEKVAQAETRRDVEPGLDILEEVHQLLIRLPRRAREIVRLFYLEGRSYEEISTKLHVPVNSIGPILSRAKQMLRQNMQARAKGGRVAQAQVAQGQAQGAQAQAAKTNGAKQKTPS